MYGEYGAFVPASRLKINKIKDDDVEIVPAVGPRGARITVRRFISELQKFPADMTVVFGKGGAFVPAKDLEIIYFDDGFQAEGSRGDPHVVIMSL